MIEIQSEMAMQVLEAARLVIYNMEKDANVQYRIFSVGFTPNRMQQGKTLLAKVLLLQAMQVSHEEGTRDSDHQLRADIKATRASFKEHAEVVRRAFQNDLNVIQALHIDRIATKKWEWMQQALHFYTHLEEHMVKLEQFGMDWSVIEQAKVSVQALLDMKENNRIHGLAEKQAKIDHTLEALQAWVYEFQSIARIAFKDNPQVLSIFGMKFPLTTG